MSDIALTVALAAALVSVAMHVVGSFAIIGSQGLYHVVYHWDTVNHGVAAVSLTLVALVAWSPWLSGVWLDAAVVGSVVTIGIAWEVYEYVWWEESEKRTWRQYMEDTALDVVVEYAVAVTLMLVRGYAPIVV